MTSIFFQLSDTYLVLDVSKALNGEMWRILTGHFCHTNIFHLTVNLLALVLLMSLFNDVYSVTSLLCLLVFAALMIGLGYSLFYPDVSQYLGLSGVLHAVASAGALLSLKTKRLFALIFLFGITTKLVSEYSEGASDSLADMIQARVAVEAHYMGALSGVMFTAILMMKNLFFKNKS